MPSENRVALVTGAASGIGWAVANAFAREGARVAALDRNRDSAEGLLEKLRSTGSPDPLFFALDVRSPADVEKVFARVVEATGRIDVLVNSAGVREIGNTLECAPEEWENVISINLSGVFFCSQAAAQQMAQTDGGSIVNISSIAGLVGIASRPAYSASKHGVIGLTKAMAKDLAEHRIRVNAVCPGLIRTPLTAGYAEDPAFLETVPASVPLGTVGEPEHVADAVVFLASEGARYITGAALPVDGGFVAEKGFDPGGKVQAFASDRVSTLGE
jgi:NAD(P)-dependent dehydrogenase (short-subunit alcohol dehydrogenase family)